MLIGFALIYKAFGTFEFQEIFRLSQTSLNGEQAGILSWAGMFVVAGAMTKSAQFPFHFWLPEAMETPTPVSALMHAGIINAGGFLLIRLSPIVAHAPAASLVLATLGAFTGVFGALVMITQNDIKRKLAYSTVSQMGLMMFACGIGAYSFALFHILAHSLYKAHAFLSTGNLVEESKKISIPLVSQGLSRMAFFCAVGLGLIVLGAVVDQGRYLAEATYLSVILLGLSQSAQALDLSSSVGKRVLIMVNLALLSAFVFYIFTESWVKAFTSTEIAQLRTSIGFESPLFAVCLAGYVIFAIGYYLANEMIRPSGTWQERFYVYLWNGGYFKAKTDRFAA